MLQTVAMNHVCAEAAVSSCNDHQKSARNSLSGMEHTGRLWVFFTQPLANGCLILQAQLLLAQDANGLHLKSTLEDTPGYAFSKVEVLVPWKYVEAVVWHDDFDGTRRQIGFGQQS
jgi:hypothetical protein